MLLLSCWLFAGALESAGGQGRREGSAVPGRMPSSTEPMVTPRPVFLRGRVVLADGAAPPDGIVIERVCGGKHWPEAYADSTGHFSFQVARNSEVMLDLSMGAWERSHPGGGAALPAGCELRASLPGYESSAVDLSMRQPLHNSDVGTIFLRRIAAVEGSTISFTSIAAPKRARTAYEKGLKAARHNKWADALKNLEVAVRIHPAYAAAWCELGRVCAALGDVAGARESYRRSLEADGKFPTSYLALAGLAMKEKNWKDLADTTGMLIRLDPVDYPAAWLYNSVAHFHMGDFDAAEKSARAGIAIDPAHSLPKLEHVLGLVLANQRDYAGAAAMFRSYLEHAPDAADADAVRNQLREALANSRQ